MEPKILINAKFDPLDVERLGLAAELEGTTRSEILRRGAVVYGGLGSLAKRYLAELAQSTGFKFEELIEAIILDHAARRNVQESTGDPAFHVCPEFAVGPKGKIRGLALFDLLCEHHTRAATPHDEPATTKATQPAPESLTPEQAEMIEEARELQARKTGRPRKV